MDLITLMSAIVSALLGVVAFFLVKLIDKLDRVVETVVSLQLAIATIEEGHGIRIENLENRLSI